MTVETEEKEVKQKAQKPLSPHFGGTLCTGCDENLTLHRGCKHTGVEFERLKPKRTTIRR